MLTRPAVGVLGLPGARWVAVGLLATAVAAMGSAVGRRFGPVAVLLLTGPALLTTDLIIGGGSMTQALGLATSWVGGWLALHVVASRPTWRAAGLVAALAGCISAYIDLMTTMPGALAITAVGATLGLSAAGLAATTTEAWRVPLAAVVGWPVGLVWMWASKWAFAAAVLGLDPVVDNVRDQIQFRLSGDDEYVSSVRTRGLTDSVEMWWRQPLTPWVVVALVGVLAAVAIRRRPDRSTIIAIGRRVLIVAVPVAAWFVALNNHSQIHAWMVYRSLALAVGGLAAVVYVDLSRDALAVDPPRAEPTAANTSGAGNLIRPRDER